MAMRYAHAADVLAQLEIDSGDTATVEAVERVENALCDAFDDRCESDAPLFGAAAVAETRELRPSTSVPACTLLFASTGIRDLTSIEEGGTWDGAVWIDGDTLATTDYRLTHLDHTGLYWAIERLAGSWSGAVRVTATWGDQAEALVPDDVSSALTFLTIRQYRRITSSPNEVVGPDGFQIITPHGWDDPLVKQAVERHRIVRLVI